MGCCKRSDRREVEEKGEMAVYIIEASPDGIRIWWME